MITEEMMIRTVFRSDVLPPGERLDCFDEFHVNSCHPMRVTSPHPDGFHATVRALDLGTADVAELSCSQTDMWRGAKLIRQSDPELCAVVVALAGQLGVVQGGREAVLADRDFVLCDSSHPLDLRAVGSEPVTMLRAHVPRALLPLSMTQTDVLLARRLSSREGVGALLVQFLSGVLAGSGSYRPGDVARLGTLALDMLVATLAHHLEVDTLVPEESRGRTLLLRIEAFVDEHLNDPDLSPRTIASAHHISTSYLHRLFEGCDTTVAGLIRRRRLEAVRRDLCDPQLRDVPVHRIATRWGFKSHPALTRAFRDAYGIPPSDYRHGGPGLSA
ncbi:helix-turn-helix domain-containing protein [Streptomyces sp. NPDC059176]|uniref:AraC-like ligand-binding domain-containing protein n=1 Tax=unclassified Streptomyces TaxID=2593676 RepID=UPI003675601A